MCEYLETIGLAQHLTLVLEPACGTGDLALALGEAFGEVLLADVFDYGAPGAAVRDFLIEGVGDDPTPDLVITNPPFNIGVDFVEKALDVANVGCAMLLRLSFLCGGRRYERLFSQNPPMAILPFCERPAMFQGVLRDPDQSYICPKTGKTKRPATATEYAWFVWRKGGVKSSVVHHIPPGTRRRLTRPYDYDAWAGRAPIVEARNT